MNAHRARRIGVYGGTFDPIHNGHLAAANQVARACQLDTVLFVPTGSSWHKTTSTSADDRLEMVRLALAGHPNFEVSRVDIDRPGSTYTVDTITELSEAFPDDELFFIMGNDAYAGFGSWKSPARIVDMAEIIVMLRADRAEGGGFPAQPRVNLVEIDALPISATKIRERVHLGESIHGLVPAAVNDFISQHKLYGASA